MELEVKLSNGWNKDFLKIIRFVFLGVSERASASVMQMGRVRKCGLCDFGRGERCR